MADNTQTRRNENIVQSAYEAFDSIKNKNDEDKKKLYQFAKRMPMRIINSGLANAILFKYNDHKEIIDSLLNFLKIQGNDVEEKAKNLVSDRYLLRLNTIKALKWLEWFNKFADTTEE